MTADSMDILSLTAVSLAFFHTLLGPDHYVPFIAMAHAGRWSVNRTVLITLLCGLGHVLSSVALGFVGVAFGVTVLRLESIESFRGDVAGWLLVAFGLLYFLWGLRRAIRNRPHTHRHGHTDGTTHIHSHGHVADHLHAHVDGAADAGARRIGGGGLSTETPEAHGGRGSTPWVLFTIFLFGPCEPLIPLLMYPAAEGRALDVVWVTALFGLTTVTTMTAIVLAGCFSARALPIARFQRYTHAFSGLAILACGIGVQLGL